MRTPKKKPAPPAPDMGLLAGLVESLPPIMTRAKIDKYLGGLVSSSTVHNWDHAGKGPRFPIVQRDVNGKIRKKAYLTPYLLECISQNLGLEMEDPLGILFDWDTLGDVGTGRGSGRIADCAGCQLGSSM